MKIWTKRAAGVGAIIGGLLVAGTVAANAAPMSMVGSALNNIPFVGQATQQVSRSDMAAPTIVRSGRARGIVSGTAVGVGVSGNKVNAPVLLCGNTVNVVGRSKVRCYRGTASSGSSGPSTLRQQRQRAGPQQGLLLARPVAVRPARPGRAGLCTGRSGR